ncbi:polysaccharide lyase [Cellvibrio sp. QJXJ]|uniref:polysaccharide lyase n=1 Tax=Cellvibrio sp. QJXJ TaxID=2964606 RepID=UPI0021C3E94A|nr:polysaccharide lyase [Cellvibrio sp. QJXJ]UUA71722.1 polysaccharide lyase [Cellvibrio sp. QJXJ]
MKNITSGTAQRRVNFTRKLLVSTLGLLASGSVLAAATGGFSTTDGGNVSGAQSFNASTHTQIQQIIENAKDGDYPVIITYTGNEDSLINQMIRDHTVDSSGNCPNPRWSEAYRKVEIKEFTRGITIQGANGSSANFGIVVNKSSNVIVRNMKIGALAGASNDADMIRIDSGVNVWIDHNELFAVNNECKGSPDGDLTFESAIDIKKESQNITVSYNIIRDSKKVGLDGSSSTDIGGGRKITFHHNIYRNVGARLPLQRGGWTHMYNNLYDGITSSGINVRQNGYALIESNWFQNAVNPVTCRFDSSNCGKWDLRNNNIRNPGDFATYNITWTSGGTIDATNWTTTAPFPISIPYSYSPVTPQCVKDKIAQYAGVGKNGAQLTASACSGGTTSSVSSSTPSSTASSSSSAAASGSINLSTSVSGTSVNLSWSTSNLTTASQEVYRDTDSDPAGRVRIATLTSAARSYTDSTASAGTYYYWIKNTTNGVVTNSNAASVTIGGTSSSSSSAASGAPVLSGTGDYPSGFSKCADLGGTCSVTSGDGWVAFGRKGNWVLKKVSVPGSIACTVSAFGSDPLGNPNKCSYKR